MGTRGPRCHRTSSLPGQNHQLARRGPSRQSPTCRSGAASCLKRGQTGTTKLGCKNADQHAQKTIRYVGVVWCGMAPGNGKPQARVIEYLWRSCRTSRAARAPEDMKRAAHRNCKHRSICNQHRHSVDILGAPFRGRWANPMSRVRPDTSSPHIMHSTRETWYR